MSHVQYRHNATGKLLDCVCRLPDGRHWNTSGTPNWEALTVANWGNYVMPASETPAGGFRYVRTLPPIGGNMVATEMWVDIYERAGASAAISDLPVAHFFGFWDGTVFDVRGDRRAVLPAGAITSATFATGAITSTTFAADAITAAAVAADVTTELQAGLAASVWAHTTRTLTAGAITSTTFATGAITSTTFAANAINAAAVAADVTTEVQAGLAASVWAHTTRTLTAGAITSTTFAADAITAAAVAADVTTELQAGLAASVWTQGTRTLTAGAITSTTFATNAINAAAVAPDVTTELQAGLAASVWTQATRTLTGAANITSTGGTILVAADGSVTAAVNAASVWAHTPRTLTAGAITLPTVDTAVITEIRAGLSTLTQAQIQALLAGIQATVSQSDIDAIRAGLSTLTQAQIQALLAGIQATISQSDIDAIRAGLSRLTLQELEAALSAWRIRVEPVPEPSAMHIPLRRGDSWSLTFTGLGSLEIATDLWFTMKTCNDQSDQDADLQIHHLQGRLHSGNPEQGSITISDAASGSITIHVQPAVTAAFKGRYAYDVQLRRAPHDVTTLVEGDIFVHEDTTRTH